MFFKCLAPGSTHHNHAVRAPADSGHAQLVANGKKHFTVDIHCHIHVAAADEMLKSLSPDDTGRTMVDTNPITAEINQKQQATIWPKLTDAEVRLKDMDAQGVDVQAISPSPFHYNYNYEADFARDTSRLVNDKVAEMVASHPDRFVGLCTVPLQNCEMAIAELDRCISEHGFKGVEISTNVRGMDLTRAGLEKFFSHVEELDTLIFMHPIGTSFKERMDDHYFRNTIGHPLESALAVGHLVFDGYLDKFPGLKVCIAHGGGYIPAYYGRFDHPYHLRDDCRININREPTAAIKQLYFDTVVFTESQLRHMIEVWGSDRVVMGTDYPYDMAEIDPVGHVDSVQGLSDSDKARVLGGNAAKLLNIDASAFISAT